MNLPNSTFAMPCTTACCEEWLFPTTSSSSGAQSASKCRGILSPTLSSSGGEGDAPTAFDKALNCCKWLQINRPLLQAVTERRSLRAGAGRSPSRPLAGAATPASWPALPGCGAKRPCRSSGLRRGCRSARPKGPSPCSLIWLRAKTNAKPQAPSDPAPSSNSNLRLPPFLLDAIY